ncbi:MAG: hypothetical protein ACBR14_17465 [Microcoleus sp.]
MDEERLIELAEAEVGNLPQDSHNSRLLEFLLEYPKSWRTTGCLPCSTAIMGDV